jgi:hypothetical protein
MAMNGPTIRQHIPENCQTIVMGIPATIRRTTAVHHDGHVKVDGDQQVTSKNSPLNSPLLVTDAHATVPGKGREETKINRPVIQKPFKRKKSTYTE